MTPNTRRTLALTALVSLLIPAAVMAGRNRPAPPPALQAGFLLHRVVERLGLTPQQVSQIREIFKAHGAELQSEIVALAEARRALFTSIHEESADETAIRANAATVGDAEGELAVTRATMVQEVRAVLTAEQQAELEEIVKDARERIEDLLALVLDRLANPLT